MSANISNDGYVSFEEGTRDFYWQYITHNAGYLYHSFLKVNQTCTKKECCFIHEHNNESVSPLNYSVKQIFLYQEFTVEEIINRIIGDEVQNECDPDISSQKRVAEEFLEDSSIAVESYPNGNLKVDIKKISVNGGK